MCQSSMTLTLSSPYHTDSFQQNSFLLELVPSRDIMSCGCDLPLESELVCLLPPPRVRHFNRSTPSTVVTVTSYQLPP